MSDIKNPKYLSAYAYFKTGDESADETLTRVRKEMPSYIAKRLTNEMMYVLKKHKVSLENIAQVIPAQIFSYLCFLMYGRLISKNEFIWELDSLVGKYEKA